MTATEWLLNGSYSWWQANGDELVSLTALFAFELCKDATAAIKSLVNFATALYTVLKAAVQDANETVEEFVQERTDDTIATVEVSWKDAIASAFFADIITPAVGAWAVLNIWESSLWLEFSRTVRA